MTLTRIQRRTRTALRASVVVNLGNLGAAIYDHAIHDALGWTVALLVMISALSGLKVQEVRAATTPRVEIIRERGKPARCRVWIGEVLRFEGEARA